ncbi:MAG: hypothetical protein IJU39_07385 [Clostridia bacterium]|nr:hypothetical protein [Clostridia bacterium]
MKMLNRITAGVLFLAVGSLTFSVVFGSIVRAQFVSPAPDGAEEGAQYVYTLREYNGNLAIFSSDNKVPITVFDTPVTMLPECDREKMVEGITAQSESQLQQLIEDYTS